MKENVKLIILINLILGCSVSQAANWIPLEGTPYSYDVETVSHGEWGLSVWVKRSRAFKADGISIKTGQLVPKGTIYDELSRVEFGCKVKWFGVTQRVISINGETMSDNFEYGQKIGAPGTNEEKFIMQVCKATKRSWEFWK